MTSRRKRVGDSKKGRRPLTKTDLLPMNAAAARNKSLTLHVALDGWRRGHGNRRVVNELACATYMAWFLQCAGYGDAPVKLFKAAEFMVEIALVQAHENGIQDGWSLDGDSLSTFNKILALFDAQLRVAPLYEYHRAETRLLAFLKSDERSPVPSPIE
ncbi:hypothetical protein [Paraburkholderia caledonica]|uniref:Fis family transcriptional regulator n=1 Tax=Paraburkholderia caledonica TaxID=134536 RepID=A0AB73IPB8_9BURK|nr:hypothetical protein [Paraburkholderia caledonica]